MSFLDYTFRVKICQDLHLPEAIYVVRAEWQDGRIMNVYKRIVSLIIFSIHTIFWDYICIYVNVYIYIYIRILIYIYIYTHQLYDNFSYRISELSGISRDDPQPVSIFNNNISQRKRWISHMDGHRCFSKFEIGELLPKGIATSRLQFLGLQHDSRDWSKGKSRERCGPIS